jgi:hypothetical protein
MTKRRAVRAEDVLARAVLERSLPVRRGESVTIETWSHTLPWARALVVEARRRGALPTLVVEDEPAFFRSLAVLGSATWTTPHRTPGLRGDALVYFGGPEAFPRLLGLPPADLNDFVARHDRLDARRDRRSPPRTVRLAIGDATPTAAARYGVESVVWQNELLRASLVDPRRLEQTGRGVVRALSRARHVRVRHRNGTDLSFDLASRIPSIDAGRASPGLRGRPIRVPSGVVVAAIRRGTAEGTWEANRAAHNRFVVPPNAVGARFEFRRGRLTEFAFERGGAPFAAAYARAGRGRERPVAFTVGLNPAITRAPEVPELGLGTVGLLLGDGPPGANARGAAFSFLSTLGHADVSLDGRPWLLGGEAVPPRGRRARGPRR